MLKPAHEGTFQQISPNHLSRYVEEFPGSHNIRNLGTFAQMMTLTVSLVGMRLMYRNVIADYGLVWAARS